MTTNKYFKEKMRLYRKRYPLSQKNYVYVVQCGHKKYAFLKKSDIHIERKHVKDLQNNIIKMF